MPSTREWGAWRPDRFMLRQSATTADTSAVAAAATTAAPAATAAAAAGAGGGAGAAASVSTPTAATPAAACSWKAVSAEIVGNYSIHGDGDTADTAGAGRSGPEAACRQCIGNRRICSPSDHFGVFVTLQHTSSAATTAGAAASAPASATADKSDAKGGCFAQ